MREDGEGREGDDFHTLPRTQGEEVEWVAFFSFMLEKGGRFTSVYTLCLSVSQVRRLTLVFIVLVCSFVVLEASSTIENDFEFIKYASDLSHCRNEKRR